MGFAVNEDHLHTFKNVESTGMNTIVDMYAVDETGNLVQVATSAPFKTVTSLQGPLGECIWFLATVDNGAMINAVNTDTYNRVAWRLIALQPSNRTLRMADGLLVPSSGIWKGVFEWGPAQVETTFEVFPSGASWQMLVGKPLLEQVHAIQDYSTDTILLPTHTGHVHIENYSPPWSFVSPFLPTSVSSPSHNWDTPTSLLKLIMLERTRTIC